MKTPSILIVCTANICRSPMAAALLSARLQKERADWQNWRIASAGTWAMEGEMAAKNSRLVLAEKGLDISSHQSRTVTADMLSEYHLILTMEPGQKEALQVEFPAIADRVFLLGEMDDSMLTIDDPYGGPIEGYRAAAEKIERILTNGMERIISLVSEQTQKSS